MEDLKMNTKDIAVARAKARKERSDTYPISIRLDGPVFKYVSDLADTEQRSISFIIRQIIIKSMT